MSTKDSLMRRYRCQRDQLAKDKAKLRLAVREAVAVIDEANLRPTPEAVDTINRTRDDLARILSDTESPPIY